jgi:LacI family transcriptional regulator
MARLLDVTLSDVARAAGLSLGGTSYALRGHPSMSAATVHRVRALAADMGYRPDLRVSSVMSAIRRGRPITNRETLAFVWVSERGAIAEQPPHFQYYSKTVLKAVQERAEQHGSTVGEFRLGDGELSQSRLHSILLARGITGVIIMPSPSLRSVKIDWDWHSLAPVIIGNTEILPVTNRVAHCHFRSVWQVLERLRGEGSMRPAAILSNDVQERTHQMQRASFLANHPSPQIAAESVRCSEPDDLRGLRAWLEEFRPDALVLGWQTDQPTLDLLHEMAPLARRVITLDWHPHGVLPGVELCSEVIATNAVDLVIAHLHRNERGIVSHPTMILLDGVWRETW